MFLLDFFKVLPKAPLKKYTETEFKSVRLKSFLVFSFSYSLYYVARLSFNVAKGTLVESGILTPTDVGIIGSGIFFTYAIGKFVNSALTDHSNLVRFFSVGLFFSAICNFLMGLHFNAFVLTLIWAFNGWVQSMGVGPCVVSLSRWYSEEERGTWYGFWSVAHNIGEGITFVVTATVISLLGWRAGFGFAGIVGLVGVFLVLKWMKDSPESCGYKSVNDAIVTEDESVEVDNKTVMKHQFDVVKNPAIWLLAFASFSIYVGRYSINSWGVFFMEMNGYNTIKAASLISICSIVGIIGTALSGWFSDKFFSGKRHFVAIFICLLNSLSLAVFLRFPTNLYLSVISLAVFGITLGIALAFFGGLLATDISHKSASGIALGMMGMFGYAGAAISEVLSGLIIDKTTIIKNGEKIYNFDLLSKFWIGVDSCSIIFAILFAIYIEYNKRTHHHLSKYTR